MLAGVIGVEALVLAVVILRYFLVKPKPLMHIGVANETEIAAAKFWRAFPFFCACYGVLIVLGEIVAAGSCFLTVGVFLSCIGVVFVMGTLVLHYGFDMEASYRLRFFFLKTSCAGLFVFGVVLLDWSIHTTYTQLTHTYTPRAAHDLPNCVHQH